MVQFNNILLAIDGYVEKCNAKVRVPVKVKKVFDKFHKETCGTGSDSEPLEYERLFVCDENGKLIVTENGEKASVKMPWSTIISYDDATDTELYLTHNHPKTYAVNNFVETLSNADIENLFLTYKIEDGVIQKRRGLNESTEGDFKYAIRGVSCESPNGSRMTLVRTNNFDYHNLDKVLKLSKDFVSYNIRQNEEYFDVYEKKFQNGDDSLFESFDDFDNHCLRETIKDVGAYEKSDKFKSFQKRFKDLGMDLTMEFPSEYTGGRL